MTLEQVLQHAVQLHQAGKLNEAEQIYQQILAQAPQQPQAMHLLGVLFHQRGEQAKAKELISKSIELEPRDWAAHNNLAEVQKVLGEFDEALAGARRSVELKSDFAPGYGCIAECLMNLGRVTEAGEFAERAVSLAPDDPNAHVIRARYLLTTGQLSRGWPEFEWRFRRHPHLRRQLPGVRWTGGKVLGKSILLTAEQGFGDVIQFVRYAPILADRGAEVFVECHAELKRLLSRVSGVATVHAVREPLPRTDFHIPMPSLPMAFNTAAKTIPAEVPYILPHPKLVEAWADLLKAEAGKLKVGIAWAGRRSHMFDRYRSCPPEALAPLAAVEGVSFYNLQKWEADSVPPPLALNDRMSRVTDFADAAALIAQLDLVIAVDTAIVHLAGAMGKPVWLMLSHAPDWRWMLDREDSPWYPTMKLYRQPVPGDWASVIERIARDLGDFKASH